VHPNPYATRYYNFMKDKYDDYVRERSLQELEDIQNMRSNIDRLVIEAK